MDCRTVDYHTAGEPFRIVAGGVPEIPGATVLERRERAAGLGRRSTRVRRLLCHEPRGHADMYGCFLVPPDDDGADLGVLFWHKDGYSTACGHGTIALGAWAVEPGRVAAPDDGEVDVSIDVPSGRVVARVRTRGRRASRRRVPQRAVVRDRRATCRRRRASTVDVAYGGAIYAFVPGGARSACASTPDGPAELIDAGRAVKARARRAPTSRAIRPTTACRASTGRSLTTSSAPRAPAQRDGLRRRRGRPLAVRLGHVGARSRCSPLTAELGDGAPAPRLDRRHDASRRASSATTAEGVLTEVEGTAFRTGEHRFTLDPRDPLGTGFVLR